VQRLPVEAPTVKGVTRTLVITTSAQRTRSWQAPAPPRFAGRSSRIACCDPRPSPEVGAVLGRAHGPLGPRLGVFDVDDVAPRSAISVPANGPAITWANSTTLIPSRAGRFCTLPATSAPSLEARRTGPPTGSSCRRLRRAETREGVPSTAFTLLLVIRDYNSCHPGHPACVEGALRERHDLAPVPDQPESHASKIGRPGHC